MATIEGDGACGFIAALVMGVVAIIGRAVYTWVPPGFVAALAVGIGTIAGYLQKENVLPLK